MRRLRHLRASRSGEHDLSGSVRVAAPRTGERWHRRIRRRQGAGVPGDGLRRRRVRHRDAGRPARDAGDRPRPLLDRRFEPAVERPADPDRLRARADRDWPQRQPGQRAGTAGRAGPPGLDLPIEQRYGSRAASVCPVEGRDRRGGDRRIGVAGAGRVFVRAADAGQADRGPRSARVSPARARPARRRAGRLLGNLRDGSDRRHLRPRRGAGRSAGDQRTGDAVDQAVCAGAAGALRLRARLLRAARQLRLRQERQRGANEPRTDSGASSTRSTPTSSCRFPTPACAPRWVMPRNRASRSGWV